MSAPFQKRSSVAHSPSGFGFQLAADSRAFVHAPSRPKQSGRGHAKARERGVALILALSSIAIMTVMLADMHESTGQAFAISTTQRDELQAEMMARSGLNLTRLLIAKEPDIRRVVSPIYRSLLGRQPPQLPVWNVADQLLTPFCNYESARRLSTGIDFGGADGLGDVDGMCEIISFAENSKINVNAPLSFEGDTARQSIAMQLFSMMGGYQSPSPYDPLFQQRDRDGNFTSRDIVVGSLIDWWDFDTNRTAFNPGNSEISNSGSEDSYNRLDDPYEVKNAPFDSLDELRLVRGIGDDFWATFVDPRPSRPQDRVVTIYGSGRVNVNEAPPEVLLARLCSLLQAQTTLCIDTTEAAKFVQLLQTVRTMIPLPIFTGRGDFMNFIEGRGGARDLYPMLQGYLGPDNPLLFTPISLTGDQRRQVDRMFVNGARILTIDVTGRAGCRERDEETNECSSWRATTHISTVFNFHERWTPPPPNAGGMPGLGIFHHYRIE